MSDDKRKPSYSETITAIGTLLGGAAALITVLYTMNIIGHEDPEKVLAKSVPGIEQGGETAGSSNEKTAKEFLEKNKGKSGVITTESGLQYKIIKKGGGDKPTPTDTVKVHYRGTLLNGTEFDNSYKRQSPVTFRLDQVIPGWTEALQLMTVSSKYQLYIPPDLAYGDRGAPPAIEPDSVLIFEVELIEIAND
ncbi:FKBP-type peptidyl-prolyl cis-trans isomerase [Desulfobulbus sp. US1]|nr:FKBP-type peptidyl-prolyl cis-trans isomerase [Desulfobulbus sp. US2]MCW5209623.1 FKBP-type peptidyl-prolyl cis-trans isomerase [Desulfobulbus sp. US1]MCW5210778.1 FKBP-type peptidyl-prolyl cis-trans isomerase [Desulfobulbus sp. N3]MCW5214069.1 FKBP-type peptidyl-prolyl cis-trans isomerase [Desulfobulbus sp. US5]